MPALHLEELDAAVQGICDFRRGLFRSADELQGRPGQTFEPVGKRELPIGGVMRRGSFPCQAVVLLFRLAQLSGVMPAIAAGHRWIEDAGGGHGSMIVRNPSRTKSPDIPRRSPQVPASFCGDLQFDGR